ncbi:MAG: glycerol-3-phosphate acyltransferase, partial [Ktedonobacterales bacterium]
AGQCWPATLRFRGGRGISAFVGAAALMDPLAWGMSLLPMALGAGWRVASAPRSSRSRSVPLGCCIAAAIFPPLCAWRRADAGWLAPLALSAVIFARRLTAPQPDDATVGPARQPRALLYRLLYDRNTSG